jgi:hypothetical protein
VAQIAYFLNLITPNASVYLPKVFFLDQTREIRFGFSGLRDRNIFLAGKEFEMLAAPLHDLVGFRLRG